MDEWDDDALTTALRRRATAMDVGEVATAATTVRQRPRRRRLARSPIRRRGGRRGARQRRPRRRLRPARRGPARGGAGDPADARHGAVDGRRHQHDRAPVDATVVGHGNVATRHHRRCRRLHRARAATTAPRTTEVIPYSSSGGSIEVEVSPNGLRLVGQPDPAPGYTVEIEDDPRPDRSRGGVLESGDRRSRITVELVDGQPEPQIEEN